LAQPEDFDFLGLISNGFPQMRRYTPVMLDMFEFRAAPAAQPLLEVIDILRAMNRDKSRSVPQNAPLEWINQRWRPYVVTEEGMDRRFYELCALTELKNCLRSGDFWARGAANLKTSRHIFLSPRGSLNCGRNRACHCRWSKMGTPTWREESRNSNNYSMKWTAWPPVANCLTRLLA
jgi:hypothetical protein